MKLFDVLQQHFNNELYEEVIFCYNVALDKRLGGERNEAMAQVFLADSHFHCGNLSEAKRLYYNSIKLYKSLTRAVPAKNLSEVEVRFRLHQCLVKLGKSEEALTVLAAIPAENAPPKVKYALYKLSAKFCKRRSLTNDRLKDMVFSCPTAFSCISDYLKCEGANADGDLMREVEDDGIRRYLEASVISAVCPFKAAQHLSTIAPAHSTFVRVEAGRFFNQVGLRSDAKSSLWKAFQSNNDLTDGMGLLAYLLYRDDDMKDLESLAVTIMDRNEHCMEAWICFGYLARLQNKLDRALHFAFKATTMTVGKAHSDALLLKANLLLDRERNESAAQHLHDLLAEDPRNLDAYEALVGLHLGSNRMREASSVLKQCISHMKQPLPGRVRVLEAAIKMRDESCNKDAEQILEETVERSPWLHDAVGMLIDAYKEQKCHEKGASLCQKILSTSVLDSAAAGRLYVQLADFLSQAGQQVEAHAALNKAHSLGSQTAQQRLAQLDGKLRCVQTPETNLPAPSTRLPDAPGAPRARRRGRSPPQSSPPPTLRLQFS
ncbi:unnamed protein product, partial [Mesorhabditis spiculigera]